MIRHSIFTVVLALLVSVPTVAQASKCYHNGQAYDDGERVGETVCRDGTWVEE